MLNDKDIIAFGIAGITTLGVVGLLCGVNGSLLAGAIATIGGIVGYRVKVWRDKKVIEGGS